MCTCGGIGRGGPFPTELRILTRFDLSCHARGVKPPSIKLHISSNEEREFVGNFWPWKKSSITVICAPSICSTIDPMFSANLLKAR